MAGMGLPTEIENEDTMAGMFLTFTLANQTYGLEIRYVLEIIGLQTVTEVPDVDKYVKGVINLRGQIIPAMDVRLRFGMPPRDYDERTCIIVVTVDSASVGFIVDRVAEVLNIADSEIQPPPSITKHEGQRFMKGLGKVGNDIKILLDVEKMVRGSRLAEQPSVN